MQLVIRVAVSDVPNDVRARVAEAARAEARVLMMECENVLDMALGLARPGLAFHDVTPDMRVHPETLTAEVVD